MACPDAWPQTGTVEYLEDQIRSLEETRVRMLDKDYIESGKFKEAVDKLVGRLHTVRYGDSAPKTLEEKMKAIVAGAEKAKSAETDLYWGTGKGC